MEENIFQPLEEYYNRLKSQDNEVENAIKSFMVKHNITTYKMYMKGGTRYVDVIGNVAVERTDVVNGTLPFPFGKVSGSFSCNDCHLTSLENSPIEVGDCFYCSGNKLESLEGAPKKVGVKFECAANSKEFTSKDIAKVSKVGHKVKVFPLSPSVTMWNGDGNYPTKVEVDKFRITTYDNVGVVIAIHVSADYYDKSQGKSMMNVSFWTKYTTTPFDGKMMKLDRVDGLEDYLSSDVLCKGLNNYFTKNINVLIEGMDIADIDFYNYDIPASKRSLLEDGYSDLWTMIADSYSHYDRMWEFIGDDWLDGVPILDLQVFDAYSKSKA